jgi:hypothetical protein
MLLERNDQHIVVDWFILCCSRGVRRGLYSGLEAELTGYLSILSR